MPWPSQITSAFAAVEGGNDIVVHNNRYHGPYNKLLYTLFPADSDFIVSSNYVDIPGNNDSDADFFISFEITLHQHPVLILEVKSSQQLLFPSRREAANRQIRQHLVDLSESGVCCCKLCSHGLTGDFLPSGHATLPILYGISAMGTKLCFYEFERALKHMSPHCTPNDLDAEFITVPEERWNCDVLEADGEQQLRALVTQIIEACAHPKN